MAGIYFSEIDDEGPFILSPESEGGHCINAATADPSEWEPLIKPENLERVKELIAQELQR